MPLADMPMPACSSRACLVPCRRAVALPSTVSATRSGSTSAFASAAASSAGSTIVALDAPGAIRMLSLRAKTIAPERSSQSDAAAARTIVLAEARPGRASNAKRSRPRQYAVPLPPGASCRRRASAFSIWSAAAVPCARSRSARPSSVSSPNSRVPDSASSPSRPRSIRSCAREGSPVTGSLSGVTRILRCASARSDGCLSVETRIARFCADRAASHGQANALRPPPATVTACPCATSA